MYSRVYRLLWIILHVLVAAYETLRWLSLRLQAATLWSYDHLCRSRASHAEHESVFLERCKTQLTKLPRHLNIIVGADDTQVDEEVLSRIFAYALTMDFLCVSVYDARLAERSRIDMQKVHAPVGVRCKELQKHQYVWIKTKEPKALPRNGVAKILSNGVANGNEKLMDKSIEIYELTYEDGRPLIADVCRTLYEQRHSADIKQLLQDRTQLTQRINNELSQRLNKIPDPELSIIFSGQMCTYGLLPWQTRFTEFHTFQTGRYFNAQAFAKVLYKYSRCEQRWGK